MSNTSKGPAERGSKHWMQIVVNDSKLRRELEGKIGDGKLTWLSPLADESFAEYMLKSPIICARLGIKEEEKKALFGFWPSRQPQWDALALDKSEETLYLFEAKANKREVSDPKGTRAKSKESIKLIENSMSEVQLQFYPKGDFANWRKPYFQVANRLTFFHKLNEKPCGKVKSVKLIYLEFVNDPTIKYPMSQAKWDKLNEDVWKFMTGCDKPPKGVKVICFDVGGLCNK